MMLGLCLRNEDDLCVHGILLKTPSAFTSAILILLKIDCGLPSPPEKLPYPSTPGKAHARLLVQFTQQWAQLGTKAV